MPSENMQHPGSLVFVNRSRDRMDYDVPRGSIRESWELFAASVPLTDAERRQIAANEAPYAR
jgi:hypothetical protein